MKPVHDTISREKEALIYCRVSSLKQLKGSGLDSQEHRCKQHAVSKNYPVAATFFDNVSGGLDLMERPAMQDLLAYLDRQAGTGKRFVVILDDHKRFAPQSDTNMFNQSKAAKN